MLEKIIIKLKALFNIGKDPDFLIIGAAKCGTTSLLCYLSEYGKNFKHPLKKEVRFFSEFTHFSRSWYRAHFPLSFGKSLTGEATPDYLFFHNSPKLIKKYGTVNKFVVILRDPSKRAYSQYCHQNHMGRTIVSDPMSFSDAIRFEENRFNVDKHSIFYREYKYFSYLQRGLYCEQLERWFEHYSRDSFYIMFLEDLEADLEGEILGLMSFLGIKYNNKAITNTKFNSSVGARISQSDEEFLKKYFNTHNKRLFDLLQIKSKW